MIDDHLTPEEQRLTQRLRNLPHRPLRASARAAIREQMMSEFLAQLDAPVPWQPVVHRRTARHTLLRTVGLVAAVGIVAAALFVQNLRQQTATTTTEVPATDLQAITQVPTSTATLTPTPEAQGVVPATPVPFTLAPTDMLTPTAPLPTTGTPVPSAPQSLTPSSSGVVLVEGPVSSINANRVTIYSFVIELSPQDPVLTVLAVGDTVHVEGSLAPNGVMIASHVSRFVTVPPASGAVAAANVNGRIESINGIQIIVNGVKVHFAQGDPLLLRLKVGDTVEVWGNFVGEGAESVLIPLYITVTATAPVVNAAPVVNNPPPANQSNPPAAPTGMGMGDDDEGMGMGMGDD